MIPTQMIHPKYAINSWPICPQAIVKLNKIQNQIEESAPLEICLVEVHWQTYTSGSQPMLWGPQMLPEYSTIAPWKNQLFDNTN